MATLTRRQFLVRSTAAVSAAGLIGPYALRADARAHSAD